MAAESKVRARGTEDSAQALESLHCAAERRSTSQAEDERGVQVAISGLAKSESAPSLRASSGLSVADLG